MASGSHQILLPAHHDPWLHTHGHVAETGAWHRFYPLVAEFLATRRPVYFDVYRRRASGTFRRMLRQGEEPPRALIGALGKRRARKHYYVDVEERPEMVRYMEDALDELLGSDLLDLEARCRLIQNLTAQLSMEIHDTMSGLAAFRQQRNIARLVEFVLAEPRAVALLAHMTPRHYSRDTHAVNVGFYALAMALEHYRRRPLHILQEIAFAFFVHDMGKARIRPSVLQKSGPLDSAEWSEMRRHPAYGYNLLEREQMLTPQARIVVMQHHERPDGRGYPDGLDLDHIHPIARICALADAFDSLTTTSPWRRGVGVFEALARMKEDAGRQFDPDLFRSFVLMWKERLKETA